MNDPKKKNESKPAASANKPAAKPVAAAAPKPAAKPTTPAPKKK